MAFLQKINSLISSGHKEAIKAIVSILKTSSLDHTPRELENEASRLVKKNTGGKKVLSPIFAKPETKISSFEHNSNFESIFIDLKGLYKQTNFLGNLSVAQKDSLIDEYSKARAAILKLINDARVFSIRNSNPEYDDIKVVNFNVTINNSTVSPSAVVDPDSRLLKLPTLVRRRAHLANRGTKTTSVTVNVDGGKLTHLGKQFPPSQAVDSRPETFWADLVYSESPITLTYNRWSHDNNGNISQIVNGPIAYVKLSFSSAEPINQIRLLPFANSPIKVLEITYRSSPTSLSRIPIPGFSVEESLDWIEFNFETIFTTDIEIVLSQESYKHSVLRIPRSILYATDILLRLNEYNDSLVSEQVSLENIKLDGINSIYSEAVKDLSSILMSHDLDSSSINNGDLAGKVILSISDILSNLGIDNQKLNEEISSLTKATSLDSDKIDVINRFEYLIGAREIECNYNVYSPIAYYESPRFEPQSTIANVKLEVDERHPSFTSQFGTFYKTSTEWEIELAEDRKIPIFPSNQVDGTYLKVNSELLNVDPNSYVALTRFKSFLSFCVIRENDKILTVNQDYSLSWNSSFGGRLQVSINKSLFNPNKIYTIDYYADSSAASVDVLSLFQDKGLSVPDTFTDTDTKNSIQLSNIPYINFSIINSDNFSYQNDIGAYQYTAPLSGYSVGVVNVYPQWINDDSSVLTGISGSYIVSGVTGLGINFTGLSSTYLTDPYRYYIQLSNIDDLKYEISQLNSGSVTLTSIPSIWTGLIGHEIPQAYFSGNLTGTPPSGYLSVPYTISVVEKFGDQIYGLNNILYEPISITVGGKKAKNITSYENLEQPAFSVSNNIDGEYQFIHDGKVIYFNQPIKNNEIKSNYRWVTKYVKVNCTLRANKIISPTVTPQVNEYRLLLNTTIL